MREKSRRNNKDKFMRKKNLHKVIITESWLLKNIAKKKKCIDTFGGEGDVVSGTSYSIKKS